MLDVDFFSDTTIIYFRDLVGFNCHDFISVFNIVIGEFRKNIYLSISCNGSRNILQTKTKLDDWKWNALVIESTMCMLMKI